MPPPFKTLSDFQLDHSALSQAERTRRVLALCASVIRNNAFYLVSLEPKFEPLITAGMIGDSQLAFWRQAHSNFADQVVVDWCKLFDGSGRYSWQKFLKAPAAFEKILLRKTGLTRDEYGDYVKAMRRQRDKFIAHLDDERWMFMPETRLARECAFAYYIHAGATASSRTPIANLLDEDGLQRGFEKATTQARDACTTALLALTGRVRERRRPSLSR